MKPMQDQYAATDVSSGQNPRIMSGANLHNKSIVSGSVVNNEK